MFYGDQLNFKSLHASIKCWLECILEQSTAENGEADRTVDGDIGRPCRTLCPEKLRRLTYGEGRVPNFYSSGFEHTETTLAGRRSDTHQSGLWFCFGGFAAEDLGEIRLR